jgi:hypothetical protein
MSFIYSLFVSFIIASAVLWKHRNHPSKDIQKDLLISYMAGVLALTICNTFD